MFRSLRTFGILKKFEAIEFAHSKSIKFLITKIKKNRNKIIYRFNYFTLITSSSSSSSYSDSYIIIKIYII